MSGHSWTTKCPKCDRTMDGYTDTRDPEQNRKTCYSCGYEEYMDWVENQMTAGELIDARIDNDVEYYEYEEYAVETRQKNENPLSFEEWTTQRVHALTI